VPDPAPDRAYAEPWAIDHSEALQPSPVRVDIPEVETAQSSRRKLGELLVEEGFLDEAELADALAEAQASGRRLGSVLVERGILSGPALANVLADQQGGIVRTEYGIATGFRAARGGQPQEAVAQSEYVVVLAKDGQYALFAGTGPLPEEGTEVTFPPLPDERFYVSRHEWRRCVVVEPVREGSGFAAA
jgi:hypothetical protein